VADPSADPTVHHFVVLNALPWTRHVRWPLPPDMGGAAPYASLEMFLVGNYRERPPLEADTPPDMVIDVALSPFGYQVVRYHTLGEPEDVSVGEGVLENRWYRIELDPATGRLKSWYDKERHRELAGQQDAWRFGQYVYEWVDHPANRQAIFALDFNREDFGTRHTDTPFRRLGRAVWSYCLPASRPGWPVCGSALASARREVDSRALQPAAPRKSAAHRHGGR
jgi:hypothetical protein